MILDAVRCFLGYPSTLLVTGWHQGTGAVITELPEISRVAIESDTAALEAAIASRRKTA